MSRGRHRTQRSIALPLAFGVLAIVLVGFAMVDRFDAVPDPDAESAVAATDGPAAEAAGLDVTTAATIDLGQMPDGNIALQIVGRSVASAVVSPAAAPSIRLPVPTEGNYLVAAVDEGRILGLALNLSLESNVVEAVRITPESTADALVAMMPGVLDRNAQLVAERIDAMRTTAPYAQLADLLEDEQIDLANPTDELLLLVAQTADEVVRRTETVSAVRPGCGDATAVYANEPDLCAERTSGDVIRIANSATRWIGIRGSGRLEPCALVGPAGLSPASIGPEPDFGVRVEPTTFDQTLPPTCGDEFVIDAPGATETENLEQSVLAGLTVLTTHTAPLGELLFATPGNVASAISADPTLIATDMIIVLPSVQVGTTIAELANARTPAGPLVMRASAQFFEEVALVSSVLDESATTLSDPLGRVLLGTLQLAAEGMETTPSPFELSAQRLGPILLDAEGQ